MIELSNENKTLCFEDSTPKPLYIFLYIWVEDEEYIDGGYYKFFKIIDNDDIILESASIDEGVLDSESFALGSFVAPKMKLRCYNDGLSHKDMLVVPVQKIGTQYIAYFDGYISSEEVVENGETIELEISSFLSQRLDVDVLPNLKVWSGENFSTMIYYALADGAAITSNISPEDSAIFENQTKTITLNENTLPDTLTVSELIRQAGEFLGANVILKEKRVVDFEEMKSYEPFHSAHINFIKLQNVETVTETQDNAYKLPYYISLYNDKTKRIKIDSLNVVTQTGEQKQYTSYWKTPIYTTYEIRNNIFFEALSAQSADECWAAIENIKPYIQQQNLYRCDLQCVYPPFIEGGDYLIANNNKHQSKLPIGYLAVESIEISQGSFLDTEIIPNSNDVQVDFTFSHFGNSHGHTIMRSDGKEDFYDTFNISMFYNQLIAEFGYYGGSVQINAFEIPFVPPEQKINLVIECKGNQYSYSGTFQGNGKLYWEVVDTRRTIEIGDGIKIYHFSYSQNGKKLCDFYPCIRESDQKIGMYDTVNNYFAFPYSEYGTPNIKYESSNVVIPTLSINSQGINSMKSNVRCTATNAK